MRPTTIAVRPAASAAAVFALIAVTACATACAATPSASLVPVAPGVSLEVLDWGGDGPAVVLLAGLGNTAHVFEDFAPRLDGPWRVVGITRRGFGASTQVSGVYDAGTLERDVAAVCDTLRLSRIVCVGHGLAGMEMSLLAARRPDLIAGLVFLDAAYDPTQLADLYDIAPPPASPPPGSADTASAAAVADWYRRTRGLRVPPGEIAALHVFGPDGALAGVRIASGAVPLILDGSVPPAFSLIRAPVLALFAKPSPAAAAARAGTPRRAEAARKSAMVRREWVSSQIASFEQAQPDAEVVVLDGASSFLFLDDPAGTARAVRGFLTRIAAGAQSEN